MKILICLEHYLPHKGGVETFTKNLWSIIKSRKNADVRIWTSNTPSDKTEKVETSEDGFMIYRIPVFNIIEKRYPLPYDFITLYKQYKELKIWQPDIVITNIRACFQAHLGHKLAKSIKKPHVHFEHSSDYFPFDNKILFFLGKIFDHTFSKHIFRKSTLTCGTSKNALKFIKKVSKRPSGLELIYNGVNTKDIVPGKTDFRSKHNLKDDEIVMTFTSRLILQKGIKLLIEAFMTIDNPKLKLAVVGQGPLKNWIKKMANKDSRILYIGEVDHNEIINILRATDIFLHPSMYPEGFPNCILEAASMGVPIIATPKGGSEEIVINDKTGYLISPNNKKALIKKITELSVNSELRKKMSKNIRDIAVQNFDWEAIADDTEKKILRLVS